MADEGARRTVGRYEVIPTTTKVLARIPVGSSPEAVAVYTNVVWVADARTKALYELTY